MGREVAPDQGRREEAPARPHARPIAEIKRDLDAVVEEYGALLARLRREAESASHVAKSA